MKSNKGKFNVLLLGGTPCAPLHGLGDLVVNKLTMSQQCICMELGRALPAG